MISSKGGSTASTSTATSSPSSRTGSKACPVPSASCSETAAIAASTGNCRAASTSTKQAPRSSSSASRRVFTASALTITKISRGASRPRSNSRPATSIWGSTSSAWRAASSRFCSAPPSITDPQALIQRQNCNSPMENHSQFFQQVQLLVDLPHNQTSHLSLSLLDLQDPGIFSVPDYLVLQFAVLCEGFYLLEGVFDCLVVVKIEGFSIARRWVVRINNTFHLECFTSVFELLRIVQLLRISHIDCFVLFVFGHFSSMFKVDIPQFELLFYCQRQCLFISDQAIVHPLEIFLMNMCLLLINLLFIAFLCLLLLSSFLLPIFDMLFCNQFSIFPHGLELVFRLLFFVDQIVQLIAYVPMALPPPQLLPQLLVLFFDHILLQLDLVLPVVLSFFLLQHVVLLEMVKFMLVHGFVLLYDFVQLLFVVFLRLLQAFLEFLLVPLEAGFELLPFLDVLQKLLVFGFSLLSTDLEISKFLLYLFYFLLPHFLFSQLPLQFLLLLSTVIQFLLMLAQLLQLFVPLLFFFLQGLQLLLNFLLLCRVMAVVVIEQYLVSCVLVLGNQLLDGQFCFVF